MAKNDVKIVDVGGHSNVPTRTFLVQDRATSSDTQIYAGEPVKILAGEGGNYAGHLAAGDPEIGTDIVIGIAASDSTETTSASGTVEVYMPVPGVVYRCKAETATNLAVGIMYDCVTFDLSGGKYYVNENEGSDENVHGLRIIGYNTSAGTVDFTINPRCTILGDKNA
jgi:hypothetical protein